MSSVLGVAGHSIPTANDDVLDRFDADLKAAGRDFDLQMQAIVRVKTAFHMRGVR